MDSVINWELIRHPYNWLIVWLMVAIVIAALPLVAPSLFEGQGAAT